MIASLLRDLYRDEEGASAIEYALIASLVAIILIAALSGGFREELVGLFEAMGDKFEEAAEDLNDSGEEEQ